MKNKTLLHFLKDHFWIKDVKRYNFNFQSLEIRITFPLSIYRQAFRFKLIAQTPRMASYWRFDDPGLLKELRIHSGQETCLRKGWKNVPNKPKKQHNLILTPAKIFQSLWPNFDEMGDFSWISLIFCPLLVLPITWLSLQQSRQVFWTWNILNINLIFFPISVVDFSLNIL